jgi:hypothetical protein
VWPAPTVAGAQEFNRDVGDVNSIVTPLTCSRWVGELRQGRPPNRRGGRQSPRDLRGLALHLARESDGWGYLRIVGEVRKLRTVPERSLAVIPAMFREGTIGPFGPGSFVL